MNKNNRSETGPRRKFHHLVAGAAALWLLLPFAAGGAGVVTNCTEADLHAAMSGGGTVTFACDGTIILAATITNATDTVLDATGHQVVISGGTNVQVFYLNTNVSLSLVNLTVASGAPGFLAGGYSSTNSSGGGVFNAGGTLNLMGVTLTNNRAARGGAVFNQGGVVNATNCSFSGNLARPQDVSPAEAHGGAILNLGGVVNLQNCVFTANIASGSSGPPWYPNYGAAGAGGAIESAGVLNVISCTFAQNAATGSSGLDGTFASGSFLPGTPGESGLGGAIRNGDGGTLKVEGSLFLSNNASGGRGGNGGSGMNYPPAPAATDGSPGGWGGSGYGGAISGGSGQVVNSTFVFNSASGGNGGNGGVGGSILSGHGIGRDGGAGGNGGSAFGTVSGGILLTNCTIVSNLASAGSGGSGGGGGTNGQPGPNGTSGVAAGGISGASCANTLLASNAPGGSCNAVTDLGHNLSSDATCAFTNVGSLNSTDPKLGPLADNGGPTLTMALLPGSPAIDGGDTAAAPTTDQRGHLRPVGLRADIGAYEYGTTPRLKIGSSQTGAVEILLYDASGPTVRLLKSATLTDWQCVATNQIGPEGTTVFQDNCGSGEAQRFYRVTMP